MTDFELSRELLRALLSEGIPEFAARLKQRLNAEFIRLGRGPFDHRPWGYPKFLDYLQANEDLVRLERPDGPGTLRVLLQSTRPGYSPSVAEQVDGVIPAAVKGTQPRIRNDVWQAFTNPDPHRRRFFHMPSASIRHYLEGGPESDYRQLIEQHPEEYREIPFIRGEEHKAWMAKYVAELQLPEEARAPIERLLDTTYSSRLNAMFTSALEQYSAGWRRKRTHLIYDHVKAWASNESIPFRTLQSASRSPTPTPLHSVQCLPADSPARHRVEVLLTLMSDASVEQVVLPFVLSVLWTESRQRR